MLTIRSKFCDYTVKDCSSLAEAITVFSKEANCLYLIDSIVASLYQGGIDKCLSDDKRIDIDASEEQKSIEKLFPVFIECIEKGLKRNGTLVVIGGGVAQDIGCFIASVLFRGISWAFIPTTLLSQADSCIGSKSSINIGHYKNQIGTFYPPKQVLMIAGLRKTLPWDEIRSGIGEIIKLQLIAGEGDYNELILDLENLSPESSVDSISKWVTRALIVKKHYIEEDEFDRGSRNILNYGHTFGHAYESATNYSIPHGIAVVLGILTASFLSVKKGWLLEDKYSELKLNLQRWCRPFGGNLLKADFNKIINAIRHDKKNVNDVVNCILTKGPGRMEKCSVNFDAELVPAVRLFLQNEIVGNFN